MDHNLDFCESLVSRELRKEKHKVKLVAMERWELQLTCLCTESQFNRAGAILLVCQNLSVSDADSEISLQYSLKALLGLIVCCWHS